MEFDKYFYYDETSPTCIRWAVDVFSGRNYQIKSIITGDVAGSINQNSKHLPTYRVCLRGKFYRVSRVIWYLFHGELQQNSVIDHLDGNTLNNNISNLKETTYRGNSVNRRKYANSTTMWNGINFHTKHNGKYTYAVATLIDENHKLIQKTFSLERFGLIPATRYAILKRREMQQNLANHGIQYSERHGK